MDFEEKILPIIVKVISKELEIYGFGIVEYYARSDSERNIEVRYQAYCVPRLPKDFHIIYPQGI